MIELLIVLAAVCLLAAALRRPLERWQDRVFLEEMEALQAARPDRDYGLELWAYGKRAHMVITGITG